MRVKTTLLYSVFLIGIVFVLDQAEHSDSVL